MFVMKYMCLQKHYSDFDPCYCRNVACVTWIDVKILAVLFTLADVLVLCLMQLESMSKLLQSFMHVDLEL